MKIMAQSVGLYSVSAGKIHDEQGLPDMMGLKHYRIEKEKAVALSSVSANARDLLPADLGYYTV
jgi:hypothetical protein